MKVALLGHGTIGVGVDHILKRIGGPEVTKILSLVIDEEMEGRTAASVYDITEDPQIGLVAEVMGGVHPAFEFISEALKAGKHVVTANKAVTAAYFSELTRLASENGVSFRYTASAGGSIPWLQNLARAKRANRILRVSGIANGTCNYILTKMTEDGVDFSDVLSEAQRLGFAERDPSADIDGKDTLRKLVLSLNVAYDTALDEELLPCAGIRHIKAQDIAFGKASGAQLKLLMNGGQNPDGSLYGFVEPVFVPAASLLSHVPGNYNLLSFEGAESGVQCFTGQGAGRYPTAYNVVEDILDVASGAAVPYTGTLSPAVLRNDHVFKKYYVRTNASSDALDGVAEQVTDQAVITCPVSADRMHRIAGQLAAEDPETFFAGILEGVEKC